MKKSHILKRAVELALRKAGYAGVRRDEVAKRAGTAAGNVNYHFGTVAGLHDAIVQYALDNAGDTGMQRIIAQAIMARHSKVAKLDDAAKLKALQSLIG
jgi:AcrR family transcriptional regulator